MYKDKNIIALIPARGGSKGLPRKNIKPLCGKPLIARSIEQAKNSKYIDAVVVSTEDKEIAEISIKYGAEVPFLRPKTLATDAATGMDVVLHAINWIRKKGVSCDLLMLLQPTSPLRSSEDIDKSIEMLFSKKAGAIISVCEASYSPYFMHKLSSNGCMKGFIAPRFANKNRQDMPKFYQFNGAIYLAYCDYIERNNDFLGKKTFAYLMPKEKSIDIDDEVDFAFAEFLMRRKIKHKAQERNPWN